MDAHHLEQVFAMLSRPAPGVIAARPLVRDSIYRVALLSDGAPALLVALRSEELTERYGERLEHVVYEPAERVQIELLSGHSEEGCHAILSCVDADAELRRYFFRVVALLLDELGEHPSAHEVDCSVRRVLELFRAMEGPGSRSVQGLWAELLVLAHAANPELVASSWHAKPRQLYDFSAGLQRVEVKSTTGPHRSHAISLDQLGVAVGGETFLVSVMLSSAASGLTIEELLDHALSRLPEQGELRRRVETIVVLSLGSDWRDRARARFDRDAALDSLRIYDARSVPSVNRDLPPEVSDVRFTVDLSSVPSIALEEARNHGGLLAALTPIEDRPS